MQQQLLLQAQIWLRFLTAAEGTLSTPCTCILVACFTRGWLLRDQLENCLVQTAVAVALHILACTAGSERKNIKTGHPNQRIAMGTLA